MGDQPLPPRLVRRNPWIAANERSPSWAGRGGRVRCHADTTKSAAWQDLSVQGSQLSDASALFEESKSKI
ncbi:hypothetical protein TomMM35A_04400 [Sphingobium sp. TomMM35A]